jgi:hypothetical protein
MLADAQDSAKTFMSQKLDQAKEMGSAALADAQSAAMQGFASGGFSGAMDAMKASAGASVANAQQTAVSEAQSLKDQAMQAASQGQDMLANPWGAVGAGEAAPEGTGPPTE